MATSMAPRLRCWILYSMWRINSEGERIYNRWWSQPWKTENHNQQYIHLELAKRSTYALLNFFQIWPNTYVCRHIYPGHRWPLKTPSLPNQGRWVTTGECCHGLAQLRFFWARQKGWKCCLTMCCHDSWYSWLTLLSGPLCGTVYKQAKELPEKFPSFPAGWGVLKTCPWYPCSSTQHLDCKDGVSSRPAPTHLKQSSSGTRAFPWLSKANETLVFKWRLKTYVYTNAT